jgi:hypothetical protein
MSATAGAQKSGMNTARRTDVDVRIGLTELGYSVTELANDFRQLGLNCTFDDWLRDMYDIAVRKRRKMPEAARFFCKPCLDAGHQCYAIDGVEFDSAEDAVCRFCDDGEECPVISREKRDREMAAKPPANGDGLKTFDKQTKALVKSPKTPVTIKQPNHNGEFDQDARDLMKVVSQTMAGVLTGDVTPAQANAVCNTANTVLKIAAAAKKMRE